MAYKLNIDWQDFMTNSWQKKPVILRNALVDFIDPISPDELAGLSLEDEIESRLVTHFNQEWQAKYGPFKETDFADLGETHWSVLVQAVDHWHDNAATLVEPFRCFPQWLFDDLMISYSVPGGGVGPHIDQYDVFIIQGMGRRRWRVGDINPDYKQFCAHPALLHVEHFTPIIDEEITAGDILYIPPGFPHDGVCLEEALSYSVGFRSPTSQELLSSFADYTLEHDLGKMHYLDPDLSLDRNPLAIQPQEIAKLKAMMCELINQPDYFNQWFGRHITHSMHSLNIEPVEPAYSVDEVVALFKDNALCQRVNSIRLLKVGDAYFINGRQLDLPKRLNEVLSQHSSFDQHTLSDFLADAEVMEKLTT
ncbi:cupin domain-containing protein [Utexia brackfieldae]|uniref:ribosomal protein uL16 3-hydroxylase n=1 Tax=Utexia brackfieldae TaxID=3074108 RepID=UPI00370D6755